MRNGNNWFLNIIALLSLAAVVFFGIAYVNSTDRHRFALEDLKKDLQEIRDEGVRVSGAAAAPGVIPAAKETGPAAVPAANAEFFDPAAVSGDRMITAIASDVGNLNPLTNNDATVSALWSIANVSLAERNFGQPDKFEPMLAESWKLSDDKLTWRIRLRPGILWHDFTDPVTGREWKNVPVTAYDFKFYVDAIRNPDVDAAPLRGYFSGISEVRVFNDLEFDVVWKEKYFLSKSITLGLMPLARHLYQDASGAFDGKRFNDDSARNRMIVGCGPYQFQKWEKGKRIVFTRFNRYFGKDLGIMPPIKTFVFEIIQHPSTRFQALTSGDIDQNNITPEQWLNNTDTKEFQDGGSLRKIKYPAMSYNYIGLNHAMPLFQDRRVRVALSHLVDRNRIIRDVYRGLARTTSGPFFPESPAYDKAIEPYPFDVEKAKKLFAEAGWRDTDGDGILDKDGKPFKFTLMFPGANPNYPKIAPILKEDFAKAGVRLELLSLEWSVVVQRIEERKFEASMLGWTSGLEGGDPYQLWHSDNAKMPGSSNYISFSNPEADRLIAQIRGSFDEAERNAAYHKLHRLFHEEQPYLFLFNPYSLLVMSSRYENLRIFPTGVPESILWTPKAQQRTVPGL